ncbi:hypothetical protein BBJ28_00003502 [Nothophytophthora sp. Chile5]|nr:hypothetical protein BBJ28_00003502 [Nothophytophthora sp. Chile5]
MGNRSSCPVYASGISTENFLRADVATSGSCAACPSAAPGGHWLIVHLILSFVLVAYVRWSRVTFHNHACNQHEVPQCCQQNGQVHVMSETNEKKIVPLSNGTVDKEDEVLPATPVTPVVPAEEEREAVRLKVLRIEYAAYLQMIKVRLPRVVVDHKMRAESKDPAILDELLAAAAGSTSPSTPTTKTLPAPIAIPATAIPVPEHTQKVETFQRMLKVGVPRHIVEAKAWKEGVNPAELDCASASSLVNEAESKSSSVNAVPAGLSTRSRRSSICSSVSTAPSTPDAYAMRSTTAPGSGGSFATLALRKMNSSMRKKLHWTTTPYTGAIVTAQRRDSLWSRIHAKAQQDRVCISTESRRWMEKLFVKVIAKTKTGRRRRSTASSNAKRRSTKPVADSAGLAPFAGYGDRELEDTNPTFSDEEEDEMEGEPDPEETEEEEASVELPGSAFLRRKVYVTLLNLKKSQNIAIVLARVKRTFPELTREILTLDCPVLSSPALQALIDMWPDSAEQEAIDQFDGDVSSLATVSPCHCTPATLVVCECDLTRPPSRPMLSLSLFVLSVGRKNLELLTRGVQQVCASESFACVLEYIFHLGNLLNFGEGVEYTKCVKSISISSLAKLSFTKAYDGRISFLQYVVQSIEVRLQPPSATLSAFEVAISPLNALCLVQRDEPHLAHFGEQLNLVSKCSKLSAQSLQTEQEALEAGLRMLVNETQKAMVYQTEDEELRESLAQSRDIMRLYAMEVEQELNGVQELVNQLDRAKKQFLNYFEEEDSLPLDELLGFIASFVNEYSGEREQLVLRARRAQKATHVRSASVNSVSKRYNDGKMGNVLSGKGFVYSENDYQLAIEISKELEYVLEKEFGAFGGGLHEKASSVESALPVPTVRSIRYIATLRNKLIHDREMRELPDRKKFIKKFDDSMEELRVLIEKKRLDAAGSATGGADGAPGCTIS